MSRLEDQHSPPQAAGGDTVYEQIAILNRQAWELSDTDSKHAYLLADSAYALASALGHDVPPDQLGIASSLRTQGYLNMRLGDYPLGLSQLTRALAILEALYFPPGASDALADIYDGLAGIYGQIGSYPETLDYIHKQLAAAERIGDMQRVANAYNNLAHVYIELDQHKRAIETLQRNLQLGIEIPYPRIECLSYLNLAEVYLMTGDYALAGEHALLGLRRSQEASFEIFEVYGYKILGKVFRLLGDIPRSLQYLDEALAASRRTSSLVTEVVILLELGQTNRAADRLVLARACFEQAASIARSIDARGEQAAAHLQLSEVYEQLCDAPQALAHFKQHQAFKEMVAGEKANQRMQVLQVAHDTALAQKEAAHLRGLNDRLEQQVAERTAELTATVALLQTEIGERERAEAAIQQMVATLEQRVAARTDELATFFDLSLLAGQGSDRGDALLAIVQQQNGVLAASTVVGAQQGLDLRTKVSDARHRIAQGTGRTDRGAGTTAHAKLWRHLNLVTSRRDGARRTDIDALRASALAVTAMGADTRAVVEELRFLEFTGQRDDLRDRAQARNGVVGRLKIALRRLMLRKQRLGGEVEHDIEAATAFSIDARKIDGTDVTTGCNAGAMGLAFLQIDLQAEVDRLLRAVVGRLDDRRVDLRELREAVAHVREALLVDLEGMRRERDAACVALAALVDRDPHAPSPPPSRRVSGPTPCHGSSGSAALNSGTTSRNSFP